MTTEAPEVVLDASQWLMEARDHIRDISKHVKKAEVSTKLSSSNSGVYINITTLENSNICVRLSAGGLKEVGHEFDDCSLEETEAKSFETIHALLDSKSPKYRESFGHELQFKLMELETRV